MEGDRLTEVIHLNYPFKWTGSSDMIEDRR